MDRLLLVDSDLFILLSAAGLLERTANLLGFSMGEMRRLPALPHMLRGNRRMKRDFPEAVRETAIRVADSVQQLEGRPTNNDVMQRLIAVQYIDGGEALLFAHLVERPGWLLTSGDLRATRALGQAGDCQDIREAIQGRVVCLEAVVRLLVEADGVEPIATAFRPVRDQNAQLRIFFSEANSTNRERCLEAVRSYFNDLVNSYGCSFLFWPPEAPSTPLA